MHFSLYHVLDPASVMFLAMAASCRGTSGGMHLTGTVALGCAAGLIGPTLRDMLIGFGGVAALHDGSYAGAALAGALAGRWAGSLRRFAAGAFFWSDALGLGLTAAMGAGRGMALGLPPVGGVLLGLTAGMAGGVMRDVCMGDAPQALDAEFYAAAAVVGCMAAAALAHLAPAAVSVHVLAGTFTVVGLRMAGRRRARLRGEAG